MAPKVTISTDARHTLALALVLAAACGDSSVDGAEASSDGSAADSAQLMGDDTEASTRADAELESAPDCVFETNALLAHAGVQTAARVDCGGFRVDARSSGNQGSVDCFLQQSLEKQTAAEFRFTTGGIDSGPVTYFVADGAGGLWSVSINVDPFGSSRSGSSAVDRCTSLDVAGSGAVYCKGAQSLYRCSGPR